MGVVLKKQTIDFIRSMTHDDLLCFLRVYSSATSELDKAQCNAIRQEIINKAKEDTNLWDKE